MLKARLTELEAVLLQSGAKSETMWAFRAVVNCWVCFQIAG